MTPSTYRNLFPFSLSLPSQPLPLCLGHPLLLTLVLQKLLSDITIPNTGRRKPIQFCIILLFNSQLLLPFFTIPINPIFYLQISLLLSLAHFNTILNFIKKFLILILILFSTKIIIIKHQTFKLLLNFIHIRDLHLSFLVIPGKIWVLILHINPTTWTHKPTALILISALTQNYLGTTLSQNFPIYNLWFLNFRLTLH
uniref:Uncharacterized protein n=1 Tax=Opuntia streptacantha TaxID=393608 RepID=A0A7C9ARP3_OPUST